MLDYDHVAYGNGVEAFFLKWYTKGLPWGGYCKIAANGPGGYLRTTQNRSKAGKRYHHHKTLEDAMQAGLRWAKRRLREEGYA